MKMNNKGALLLKNFQELDVELGKFNKNLFNAWCDIDCTDVQYFLNWLLKLNRSNILTYGEQEVFVELQQHNLVRSSEECKENLRRTYPDVLDTEDCLLEIELLENKIELLSEEERRQQNVLVFLKQLKNEMNESISKEENDVILSNLQKGNACKDCIELTNEVQEIDNELQKISKWEENLSCPESIERPFFISKISSEKNEAFCNKVISRLNFFLQNQVERSHSSYLSKQSFFGGTFDSSRSYSRLEEFSVPRDRIFRSFQTCISRQITEHKLKAELQNIKSLRDILLRYNSNHDEQLEMVIMLRSDEITISFSTLQKIIEKTADLHICQPKINFMKAEIKNIGQNVKVLNNFVKIIDKLLSVQSAIQYLIKIEQEEIAYTDVFFQKILLDIMKEEQNCEIRCNAMREKINEYNSYQKLSFEERCPFIKGLLQDRLNNPNLLSLYELENKRREKQEKIGEQFFVDIDEDVELFRKVERYLRSQKTILMSGPVSTVIIVPYHLLKMLREAEDSLETLKSELISSSQIHQLNKKKLTQNKIDHLRHLLWIYFLTEREKYLSSIASIEEEIKQQIKNNM